MRRRRLSSESSNDDTNCFEYICQFIGCLLCFSPMQRKTRIFLTWFWLVVISVVSGILVSNAYFSTTKFTLHSTDMRLIDVMSTTWCSSMYINATNDVTTYELTGTPDIATTIDSANTYRFRLRKDVLPIYEYREFYFLRGSIVSVEIENCWRINQYANVYVLKGDENLNTWVKNPECLDCISDSMSIDCISRNKATFKLIENGQYYFVIKNRPSVGQGQILYLQFIIQRTVYDLDDAVMDCYREPSCSVKLDDTKPEAIVVYSPASDALSETTLTATCKPQYYVFLPVFALVPMCLGLAITGIIVSRPSQTTRPRRQSSQIFTISDSGDDTSGSGGLNPAFFMEPPEYSECCDHPPTYEEAMRLKTVQSVA